MDQKIIRIIKHDIRKHIVPIRIFTKELNNVLSKFQKNIIGILTRIKKILMTNAETTNIINPATNYINESLTDFINYELVQFKSSKHYRLNYAMTFLKIIHSGEFRDIKHKKITNNSVSIALKDFADIDYAIFITSNILMSDLWLLVSDTEHESTVIGYLNKMYQNTLEIWNNHIIPNDYDIMYTRVKIPYIRYKSKLHSKKKAISSILTDSINSNKMIKDEKYRQEVIDISNKIVQTSLDVMSKNDVDDSTFDNMDSKEESLKIMTSFLEINKDIKREMALNKIKPDIMTEIGVSIISKYKNSPVIKEQKSFIAILIFFIEMIDKQKKANGGIIPDNVRKLYTVFKDIKKESVNKDDKEVMQLVRLLRNYTKHNNQRKIKQRFKKMRR